MWLNKIERINLKKFNCNIFQLDFLVFNLKLKIYYINILIIFVSYLNEIHENNIISKIIDVNF